MAPTLLPGDSAALRKARGAFFTPPEIADFLTGWALAGRQDAEVLDPTCGEGVFLLAAARRLAAAGASPDKIRHDLHGIDLHRASLNETRKLLTSDGFDAHLSADDFFNQVSPAQLGGDLPWMDAVVGNPPFVRYHDHRGDARRLSSAAALAQGVRLSGLASSWAALLVHASSFLKPDGRVAMVLPAELLTVGYAEPVRRWLRQRFSAVHLVLFEQLQFAGAEEHVVLLVARGSGGCDAFALHQVHDAQELRELHVFDGTAVAPEPQGKWTDLLLPVDQRNAFRRIAAKHFVPLADYGQPELGTVTGANKFFAISEGTKEKYGLATEDLARIVPPGTKHLRGSTFTQGRWEQLRIRGKRVWLLDPRPKRLTKGLARYVKYGEQLGVPDAYKCSVRDPWWKPPTVPAPDLFFTYMSHRMPRIIRNSARVSFLNSMHGIRLAPSNANLARAALPLLALNSVTALGAEVFGRSYGGGVLKMEPSEAAQLPVPNVELLAAVWERLASRRAKLDDLLRAGSLDALIAEVDTALLSQAASLPETDLRAVTGALAQLRRRRTGQTS